MRLLKQQPEKLLQELQLLFTIKAEYRLEQSIPVQQEQQSLKTFQLVRIILLFTIHRDIMQDMTAAWKAFQV